jgi:hypothetical protein
MSTMPRYTREALESMDTNNLGRIYIEAFLDSDDPQSSEDVAAITEVLKDRTISMRAGFYRGMRNRLDDAVSREAFEQAARIRDMIDYFQRHILD